MTTGDPGTSAQVTNSGTSSSAIFDFVIPRGQDGCTGCSVQVLSAYSTPSQTATVNNPLIFDRNSTAYGTAITHANNSGQF